MSDEATIVDAAEANDGLRRWRLFQRSHGFYVYEEYTLQPEIYHVDEDGSEGTVVADAYWMPTHVSGLFDAREAAREDAMSSLPWLRMALETRGANAADHPHAVMRGEADPA